MSSNNREVSIVEAIRCIGEGAVPTRITKSGNKKTLRIDMADQVYTQYGEHDSQCGLTRTDFTAMWWVP